MSIIIIIISVIIIILAVIIILYVLAARARFLLGRSGGSNPGAEQDGDE